MRRSRGLPFPVRLFIGILCVGFLWALANTIGLTQTVDKAEGWSIPSNFTVPAMKKYVTTDMTDSGTATAATKACPLAYRAAKIAIRVQYGETASSMLPESVPCSDLGALNPTDLANKYDIKIPSLPGGTSTTATTSSGSAKGYGPTSTEFTGKKAYKQALADLADLKIKGRAPMTGYSRAQFGAAWTDDNDDAPWGHNGCDTRNDALKRDLTKIVYKAGTKNCVVASGTLHDPYTNTSINFTRGPNSAVIQIDHLVPLGNAWVTGAQSWIKAKRVDYANDPLVLLTAQGKANEAKGDGDAAAWLPANKAYRPAYVAHQIAIKHKYGLWVTQAEHDTMKSILTAAVG